MDNVVLDVKTSSMAQTKAEFEQLGAAISETATEFTSLKKAQDIIASSSDGLGKKQLEMRERINSLGGILKGMVGTTRENTTMFKDLEKQLTKNVAEYERITVASKKAETGQKSIRTEIRQTTQELARQLANGDLTITQMYDIAKGAGHLKDAYGDATKTISALSSDTFGLDSAIQVVTGVAAGFQIAQGAAALFGGENKDLQKTLVKLNAIMAITQGFQQVQNFLQKENAGMLGLNIVQTKAYAFAQRVQAIAIGESTGALAAFRAIMLSLGIGVVLAAIAGLVVGWEAFKNAVTGVNDALEKNVDKAGRQVDAAKEALKVFDLEEKKLKLLGVREEELIALRNKRIDAEIQALEKQQRAAQRAFDATAASYVKGQKISAVVPFTSNFFASEGDLKEKADRLKQINDDLLDAQGQYVDGRQKLHDQAIIDQKKELESEIAFLQARKIHNKDNAAVVYQIDLQLSEKEKELALVDEKNKGKRALAEATDFGKRRDLRKEYQKLLVQDEIDLLETQKIEMQHNATEVLKIDQKLIDARARLAKLGDGNIAKRGLIDSQTADAQSKVLIEFYKATNKRVLDDAIATDNAYINQRLLTVEQGSTEELQLKIDLLENQKALDELAVAQSVDTQRAKVAKLLQINAKYNSDVFALQKAQLDAELAYTLSLQTGIVYQQEKVAEDGINNEKFSFDVRKGSAEKLAQFKLAQIQVEKAAYDDMLANNLISQQNYNLKVQDLANQEFDIHREKTNNIKALDRERLDKISSYIGTAADDFSQAIGLASNIVKANTDAELAGLDEKRKKGIISQQQYEKDSAKIKNEAAKKQREFDIASATAKIPQAVLSAYIAGLQVGGVAGPIIAGILAGLAGAFGLAQVALIAAAPLPKFFQGVLRIGRGNNPKGRDTIPSMLHEGESVMTSEETDTHFDVLKSIRNKKFHQNYFKVSDLFNKNLLGKVNLFKNIAYPVQVQDPNYHYQASMQAYQSMDAKFAELKKELAANREELAYVGEHIKQGNTDRRRGNAKMTEALSKSSRKYN